MNKKIWAEKNKGLLLYPIILFPVIVLVYLIGSMNTVNAAIGAEVNACQCLLTPGENIDVSLALANDGEKPVYLLVALKSPDGQWRFYSPGGLISTPTWLSIQPFEGLTPISLFNEMLTPDSLPFGHVPLVGPFRYEVLAALWDGETGQQISPFSYTYFDFAPQPYPPPYPESPGTLYLIPHHHNDLAWLKNEDINLRLGANYLNDSVIKALEDSSYRFVVDQKPILEAFSAMFPDRIDDLKVLIDQGRCELSGGFLVEPDLNMISGESLVRQVILGQQYLENTWGRRSRVGWNIDSFGHSLQIPQICKKAGMTSYAFSRGERSDKRDQPTEFYWLSPEGSSILVHKMPYNYQIGREIGSMPETHDEISELYRLMNETSSHQSLMALVGADANENVFNNFLSEAISAWNINQINGASSQIATPTEYFNALKGLGSSIPNIANIEFINMNDATAETSDGVFPGTYGSRIDIKKTNSRLEQRLLDVEKISTFASLTGMPYPESALNEITEMLALNQTHDYIGGCGVDDIYEDPDSQINDFGDRAALVDNNLIAILEQAGQFITAKINTNFPNQTVKKAFALFNTMSWHREEIVSAEISDSETIFPARLIGSDNIEIPYQKVMQETGKLQIYFKANMPSMGYATYRLVSGDPMVSPDEQVSMFTGSQTFDWNTFRIKFDSKALLQEIQSIEGENYLLGPNGSGGDIWWADELYGNAYAYDPLLSNVGRLSDRQQTVYWFQGPVIQRILAVGSLADHSMSLREIRFAQDSKRIDFITSLYWADLNKNVFLNFSFTDPVNSRLTQGVPYGFITRTEGWYPAMRWSDYGNPDTGLTLLNRGLFGHKYKFDETQVTADVTLLRSMDRTVFGDYSSELMKEYGIHKSEYALAPRKGSWQGNMIPQKAWEYTTPPLVFSTNAHDGSLPDVKSYLSIEPENGVVVSALFRQGKNLIIRLYETLGQQGVRTVLIPETNISSVAQTNLLGDHELFLTYSNGFLINSAPQEITSIRIAF